MTADDVRIDPAATYARARLVLEGGDPEAALALIEAARDGYAGLGQTTQALRTDLGRMHVLDDLGRHTEAARVGAALLDTLDALLAAAALDGTTAAADVLALQAAALGNLGVARGFTGDHDGALASYRRAESLWRSLGSDHDAAIEVANQGIELLALGRAHEALDRLTAAQCTFDAADDTLWRAKCIGHRGEALSALGRFVDALDCLRHGADLHADLGAGTEAWRLDVELASTLLTLGLADEAVTLLARVEPSLRQAGLHHDLAVTLLLRGTAELARSHPDRAREHLSEAVLRFAEVGDVPGQAKALIELSRSLDPGEAADVAEQAAALVQDRLPGLACLAQVRLAEVHADDESRQRAALDRAAALVAQVDLPQLRHAVMLTDGLSLLRHGHLDVAVDVLGQALAQVERAASVLPDATLRAAYTGSRTAALTGLVQALLVRDGPGDVAHAARLVDDAHGRTLVAGLLGEVGPRRAHRSGSVRTLLGELDAAYSALFTADRPQQRVLRERIDALEGLIAVQETLTAGSSPSGPATGSAATAPATAAVPSICYQVSGDEILAFVTAGATRVVRHVSSRRRLRDLVEDLERHVGPSAVTLATRHSAQRLSACRAVLEALYVELFAPLAHLLPDRASRTGTGSGQLVVVPDGVLHRVPFNALHDGVAYLLDSWDITLAPSLEAAAHAAARPVRGRRVLAVGVGTDDAPHIETEALAVSRTAAGDHPLLLGADATFDAVREAAQDADVVHLACHGLFRPENPAFSSLRLADRWIRAVDVAGLDLDGRLVVLSACETGRVDDREGDEAIGLARGFLAAGARNVIVSQWLADDRTAAEVMTRVHAFLARGVPPGTALRRAQQAVREVDPHPFHWAPFVVVGAPASSPPEAS